MTRVLIAFGLAAALVGVAVPSAAGAVPRGFYGVMWDRAAPAAPAAEQDRQWALMAQSGVESVRTVFSWAQAQPRPDEYDWREMDRRVELASRNRIKLLPIVMETPDWAASEIGPGARPARLRDYTAFLRTLVRRYGPRGSLWDERDDVPRRPLREWQVWNEPHLGVFWNPDGPGPNAWAREYARLLRASKRAIESVDRRAVIVLCSLADFAWRHLDRLNRFRIRRHFDVAALNFFTSRPRNVMKGVRYFRRALARGRERRKPIWITETTWPAAKGIVSVPATSWQRAWYTTDGGMAARLSRLYRVAARNRREFRLRRVYWYTWSSAYSGDGDLFDYSGLNRYSGGAFEPRPALEAFARSARR